MTLTFTTTDTAAATGAAGQLRAAARSLRSQITVSSDALAELESDDPARAAAALERWRRRQFLIRRRENELMLLLAECGASERGLGEVMGLNRQTVARRLTAARDEREAAS